MRVMRLSDSAQAPVLIEENVPQPQPQRGELLVYFGGNLLLTQYPIRETGGGRSW